MKIIKQTEAKIEELVTALRNGAVLVLPTDTVCGLVCDATNEKAVEKIFEIKKRDKSKTLPVFVNGLEMAKRHAVINKKQEEFLDKNWPGAVTVVLGKKEGLSSLVYKGDTIALRQPNYELVGEIINLLGKPLAQTSANISDEPVSNSIQEIIRIFSNVGSQLDLIIDGGDLPKNKPSVIIDLTKEKIEIIRK